MSNEPQPNSASHDNFTHLDIGGGTDKGTYAELQSSAQLHPEFTDIESRNLLQTRTVELARNDPAGNYMVLDPNFLESTAAAVTSQVPNVHFVRGLVSANHGLPFLDQSFNIIEVNHLFYPLLSTSHLVSSEQSIEAKVAKYKDDIIQQATGMINNLVVEQQAEQYRQQLLDDVAEITPKLEATGTPEDFLDYVAVLKESSRALKPGGKLILAEKRERMDTIIRILRNDDDILLKSLGLVFGELKENQESSRSAYARGASKNAEKALEEGDPEKANKSTPMLLTLIKP